MIDASTNMSGLVNFCEYISDLILLFYINFANNQIQFPTHHPVDQTSGDRTGIASTPWRPPRWDALKRVTRDATIRLRKLSV